MLPLGRRPGRSKSQGVKVKNELWACSHVRSQEKTFCTLVNLTAVDSLLPPILKRLFQKRAAGVEHRS